MEWTDALRKYASIHNRKWHIPKKGTPEYAAVKALQAGGGGGGGEGHPAEEMENVPKGLFVAEKGGVKLRPAGKKNLSVVIAPAKGGVVRPRKVRSDKGKKRGVVAEVAPAAAPAAVAARMRKERSDKGQKRGTKVQQRGRKALRLMPLD